MSDIVEVGTKPAQDDDIMARYGKLFARAGSLAPGTPAKSGAGLPYGVAPTTHGGKKRTKSKKKMEKASRRKNRR